VEELHEPVDGMIVRHERAFSRTDREAIDSPETAGIGEVRQGRAVLASAEGRKRPERR
jgi:hypothetical protein